MRSMPVRQIGRGQTSRPGYAIFGQQALEVKRFTPVRPFLLDGRSVLAEFVPARVVLAYMPAQLANCLAKSRRFGQRWIDSLHAPGPVHDPLAERGILLRVGWVGRCVHASIWGDWICR